MTDLCPVCRCPYLEVRSTNEEVEGTFDDPFPRSDYESDHIVCYDVSAYPSGYFGFTLYFHPEEYSVVEYRFTADEEWTEHEKCLVGDGVDELDRLRELYSDDEEFEARIRHEKPGR